MCDNNWNLKPKTTAKSHFYGLLFIRKHMCTKKEKLETRIKAG